MSDPVSELQTEVATLHQEVASLRADLNLHRRDPQLHAPRPLGVPSEDLQALRSRVAQKPSLTLHQARAMFGRASVEAALTARLVYRSRPDGGSTVLTVEPPRPSSIDVAAYLREPVIRAGSQHPRTHATMDELRNVFNRNTVNIAVEDALRRGEIARGILQTGRAGRPPRVVILADAPKPTHVDGLPVKWET